MCYVLYFLHHISSIYFCNFKSLKKKIQVVMIYFIQNKIYLHTKKKDQIPPFFYLYDDLGQNYNILIKDFIENFSVQIGKSTKIMLRRFRRQVQLTDSSRTYLTVLCISYNI